MFNNLPRELNKSTLIDCMNFFSEQSEKDNGENYVFRGESHDFGKTSCTPSLFREHNYLEVEDKIIEETMEKYPQNFDDVVSNTDVLLTLQHYGVPTRLLDVTTNFLVALFFSCQDTSYDGRIYYFPKSEYVNKSSYSDTISMISSFSRLDGKTKKRLIFQIFPVILCITYIFKELEFTIKDNIDNSDDDVKLENIVKENIDNIEIELNEKLKIYISDDETLLEEKINCVKAVADIFRNEVCDFLVNGEDYKKLNDVKWNSLFNLQQTQDISESPIFPSVFQQELLNTIKNMNKDNFSYNIIYLRKSLNNGIPELKRLAHEVRRYYPGFVNEVDILDFYNRYISSSRNINNRIINQSGLFILPKIFEFDSSDTPYIPDFIEIKKESKKELLKIISFMGVNEQKMYPELNYYKLHND